MNKKDASDFPTNFIKKYFQKKLDIVLHNVEKTPKFILKFLKIKFWLKTARKKFLNIIKLNIEVQKISMDNNKMLFK
jgi:hypothetical protein